MNIKRKKTKASVLLMTAGLMLLSLVLILGATSGTNYYAAKDEYADNNQQNFGIISKSAIN